jgi:hypothetical protein
MSVLDFVVFGSALFYFGLIIAIVAPWLFGDEQEVFNRQREEEVSHGAGLSLVFRA